MAERRLNDEEANKAAAASSEDRIPALPDDLLQYVLSFLSSREAVWTCVLASRWRDLWKSVPALRLDRRIDDYTSVSHFSKFANYLLLLRERTPLHECEITSVESEDGVEASQYIDLWIRYALSCNVQVLRAHVLHYELRLELPDMPFVSQHLTRLNLGGMVLRERSLNFSHCPALEVLQIGDCAAMSEDISFQSVKHLSIKGCLFLVGTRASISGPSLLVLEFADIEGSTPRFEIMPTLITAFVRLEPPFEDDDDIDDDDDGCVLLEGLSGATNLELISDTEAFIFRRDFQWDLTFSKLKTLLLSEWSVAPDFSGLLYFLQYSPILEKLTLQLVFYEEKTTTITEENYNFSESFLVSKNLKVVEIKYGEQHEIIQQIIMILGIHGVPAEHIHILQQKHLFSDRFSFE